MWLLGAWPVGRGRGLSLSVWGGGKWRRAHPVLPCPPVPPRAGTRLYPSPTPAAPAAAAAPPAGRERRRRPRREGRPRVFHPPPPPPASSSAAGSPPWRPLPPRTAPARRRRATQAGAAPRERGAPSWLGGATRALYPHHRESLVSAEFWGTSPPKRQKTASAHKSGSDTRLRDHPTHHLGSLTPQVPSRPTENRLK